MRVIDSSDILRFSALLDKAYRIAIVTHMKPDGDALGSCTALYHFLKAKDRQVRIVLNDAIPQNLSFLTENADERDIIIYQDRTEEALKVIDESELLVCSDFNNFSRTGYLEIPLRTSTAPKVLIDHHIGADKDSFTLVFSDTEISSASELLYHILMSMPAIGQHADKLPLPCAASLMTGMITDTNNFANSTYPSTLRMASELLEAGVDRDRILYMLYNRFSESRLRLLGHILQNLLTITPDGVAYIVLDRETLEEYHIEEGDTEGFVNMPLSIGNVTMSLLLKEDGDKIRVSIRSKKGISANRCARLWFNGGGHENASGGRLYIPQDVKGMEEVAAYIERHTHIFMTDEKDEER